MRTTQPTLSKYICGMVASLILLLGGGWLILSYMGFALRDVIREAQAKQAADEEATPEM